MKKLLFIFFLSFSATAQQASLLSLQEIGGNGVDQVATNVTTTADGGFIICITSTSDTGTGNIDSFCSFGGDRGIFLKYNADASVLEWNQCTTNGSYLFPIDSDNFILGGLTDPSTGWAFKIIKEDSLGNIIWRKTYGNNADAILRSMIATDDGGYIMMGETNYTDTDVLIHYGSSMNADIWVLKLDSNGYKVWSTVLGGTGNQQGGAVIKAPNNGCYVVGTTTSDNYDCTGNHGDSSGSADAYLARLDSNGNIIWHKDIGGSGNDEGNYGWPDGKGGIIVGATSGSHDGDVTNQINYNGNNMWALEVDSSGNILWNNCYGGGGDEFTNSICKATDGSIWIGGDNDYRDSFEVDTFYGGNYDAWFVHADSVGNFLSAKVLGSTGQDEGFMVYPLTNGSIIAGGYYEYGNRTFNTSFGNFDAFLATFSPWTEGIQNIAGISNGVTIYPNPASEEVTIKITQVGNYNVVITDVLGREVLSRLIDNGHVLIVPVMGWREGMYLVQVISENGFKTIRKLLVE